MNIYVLLCCLLCAISPGPLWRPKPPKLYGCAEKDEAVPEREVVISEKEQAEQQLLEAIDRLNDYVVSRVNHRGNFAQSKNPEQDESIITMPLIADEVDELEKREEELRDTIAKKRYAQGNEDALSYEIIEETIDNEKRPVLVIDINDSAYDSLGIPRMLPVFDEPGVLYLPNPNIESEQNQNLSHRSSLRPAEKV